MPEALTFVGRGRELGVLAEELEAARAGVPRVVLVRGPPGIGKTSLVERFVAAAGVRVARASGDESETGVVFGVADQLVRHAGERIEDGDHVQAGARLLALVGELQADGPALLLVDDAQWADPESLRALLFAVRRLVDDAVLVLLVVREGEGDRLPDGLRKLARHVVLEPLAVAEVRELADGVGVSISARGARRLHEHSGGSPLHARALLDEVPARAWDGAGINLPAPRSYAALVTERVGTMPEPAVRLLEAAAVLGMRTPLALAARVAEIDEPFEALEAPVAARLVGLDDGPDVRFVHPLIRAAIHQGLAPARRARLHALAATVVEDEGASLAHRVAASAGHDPRLALELEAFAGRGAEGRRWAAAVWALEAAARLSTERADRERRVLGAVEAAMYGGDGPRARALAALTDGFAPGPLLDNVLAYVALGTGQRDEAQERLRRAWDAAADGDDAALAGRIAERRAFLGILRLRAGDAVEWARRAQSLRPESFHSWWLALGLHWSGHRAEAHAVVEEERRLGRGFGAIGGAILLADDEVAAARRALAAQPISSGSLVVAARALAKHSQAAFAAGDWDDAVVLAERAQLIATESDEVAAQALAGWAALSVAAARGEFDACERQTRALRALPIVFEAHVADAVIGVAETAAVRGRHDEVLEALDPLVTLQWRDAIDHPGHWPWAHLYADALVRVGRLVEADAFLAVHERIATDRGVRSMRARLGCVRAALHAVRDEHAAAEAEFAVAREALPGGMPYERALIEYAHGRFLRRAGRRRAAAGVLEGARDAFAALGARPLLERCSRELEACGLTPVKRGESADRSRLTPQERSVAQLAASGLSNRQVAAELLLSVKTVEHHLTSAFRKLGVDSRSTLRRALPDP